MMNKRIKHNLDEAIYHIVGMKMVYPERESE